MAGCVVGDQDLHVECPCGHVYDTEREAVDEDWAKCPNPDCGKLTSELLRELASSHPRTPKSAVVGSDNPDAIKDFGNGCS